jgi:hypothetical protein
MRKRAAEVIGDIGVVVEKVALTSPLTAEEVRLRPFGLTSGLKQSSYWSRMKSIAPPLFDGISQVWFSTDVAG